MLARSSDILAVGRGPIRPAGIVRLELGPRVGSGLAGQLVELRRVARNAQQFQQLVFQFRPFELEQLKLQRSCRFSFQHDRRNRKLANCTGFQYEHSPGDGYPPQQKL